MFSDAEKQFLSTQRLARIATVSDTVQPDVAPVGFEFDGTHIFVGGRSPEKTLKYKNIASGQTQVAIVVDDLKTVNPWQPRGIKIHGHGELTGSGIIKITPLVHWHWGILGTSYEITKVDWNQE